MTFVAGQRLTAAKLQGALPLTDSVSSATEGTTTSTSYTGTLSGGVTLTRTFNAPDSGVVLVWVNVTQYVAVAANVWTGCKVVGDITVNAADADALHHFTASLAGGSRLIRYTGLTAGTSYTATMMHRVDGSTGHFLERSLIVMLAN
jgi:hypothetical protein